MKQIFSDYAMYDERVELIIRHQFKINDKKRSLSALILLGQVISHCYLSL